MLAWGWRQTPRAERSPVFLPRMHLEHLFCFDPFWDIAEEIGAPAREPAPHSASPKHAKHWAKQPITMSIIGGNTAIPNRIDPPPSLSGQPYIVAIQRWLPRSRAVYSLKKKSQMGQREGHFKKAYILKYAQFCSFC